MPESDYCRAGTIEDENSHSCLPEITISGADMFEARNLAVILSEAKDLA